MYSPSLVIVCEYFDKKRSLAIGLATSGACVGSFVIPIVMVFQFEHYGLFDGLFLLGAATFNCCVSGALYRPIALNRINPVASSRTVQRSSVNDVRQSEDDVLSNASGSTVRELEDDTQPKETASSSARKAGSDTAINIQVVDRRAAMRLRNAMHAVGRSVDVTLWRDRRLALFAASQMFAVMSCSPVLMLTPAIAVDNGMTTEESAFLLSSVASGDIVGRLVSGVVFDLPSVRRHVDIRTKFRRVDGPSSDG